MIDRIFQLLRWHRYRLTSRWQSAGVWRRRHRLEHEAHVLINKRQDILRQNRPEGTSILSTHESWLYEAKVAAEERRRLPLLFAKEHEGRLTQLFRYCSFSPAEPVANNHLTCCLGQKVQACPILRDVVFPLHGQFPAQLVYEFQADICVGHVVWACAQKGHMVHDNEGYVQSVDDRMFWNRVYDNMAASDPADDKETPV